MSATPYEYTLMCIMSSHRAKEYFDTLTHKEKQKHRFRKKILHQKDWLKLPTIGHLTKKSTHGYFGVA